MGTKIDEFFHIHVLRFCLYLIEGSACREGIPPFTTITEEFGKFALKKLLFAQFLLWFFYLYLFIRYFIFPVLLQNWLIILNNFFFLCLTFFLLFFIFFWLLPFSLLFFLLLIFLFVFFLLLIQLPFSLDFMGNWGMHFSFFLPSICQILHLLFKFFLCPTVQDVKILIFELFQPKR